ncbi:MAG TPA: hypothetical protein VFL91_20870 [Thermomicrobiales bacterium]|nr:hypothetical protein [Thermomicrobiales bacterium]
MPALNRPVLLAEELAVDLRDPRAAGGDLGRHGALALRALEERPAQGRAGALAGGGGLALAGGQQRVAEGFERGGGGEGAWAGAITAPA